MLRGEMMFRPKEILKSLATARATFIFCRRSSCLERVQHLFVFGSHTQELVIRACPLNSISAK